MAQDIPPWQPPPLRDFRRPVLGLLLSATGLPLAALAFLFILIIGYGDDWSRVPDWLWLLCITSSLGGTVGLVVLLRALTWPRRRREMALSVGLALLIAWGLWLPLPLVFAGLLLWGLVLTAAGAYTLLLRWLEVHGR
jgi:hypothetical protein